MSTFFDILLSLNKSKICIAAYVDVKKAFNTIDHGILLTKLKSAGIGRSYRLGLLLEN